MNSDFLIKINNSKELEENNIILTNSNIYCYWCDKEELEKISLTLNDKYSHISCFLSSQEDKITNLVNGGYILIFIKTPKLLYGIIKIDSIIMKSLPQKHYLEDDDEEYIKNLTNNKLITIDNDKYIQLVEQYKFVEVPKMFIVKFSHLYHFGYEIGIKKLNDYVKKSSDLKIDKNIQQIHQAQNFTDFKYPHKVQNKELVRCWDNNFLNNFLNYLNHLNSQDKIILETDTDLLSSGSFTDSISGSIESEKTNIETFKIQKFCIPILWNGCDIIKDMLVKSKSKPNKKLILKHYTNCADCEINDNNNKLLSLDNKKLVIKNINSIDDIKLFDLIINNYTNIDNLNISNISNNFEFEKGKINIISCPKSKNIYSNCIFIIE
jgi:hypothetical protein